MARQGAAAPYVPLPSGTRRRADRSIAISRSTWRWLRLGGGALILGALLVRVGADPFVDGLRRTTPAAIATAMAITILTTVCCAWRWSLVAGRLGVTLPLQSAVSAYYRSQFVNSTLPGGVLGDVHRAVQHGRDAGHLGIGVRSVACERALGLVAHIGITLMVVALLPSSLRPAALGVAAATVLVLVVLVPMRPLLRSSVKAARLARAVVADGRVILGSGTPRWGIALSSIVAVAGHTVIFVLAARTAGVPTSTARLVPVAMVVLTATAIPMSVAGWGPREVVAAGAFGTVGLSADQGVTVAVVYGVLALIATLPGAILLLTPRAPQAAQVTGRHPPRAWRPSPWEETSHG